MRARLGSRPVEWVETACLTRTLRRRVEQGRSATDDPSALPLEVAAHGDGLATQLAQEAPDLTPGLALEWMRTLSWHEIGASFSG